MILSGNQTRRPGAETTVSGKRTWNIRFKDKEESNRAVGVLQRAASTRPHRPRLI